MNLHIIPDSSLSRTFYNNIEKLGLLGNNKFIVRSNKDQLTYIKTPLPFGKPGTGAFDQLVGDTKSYQKVFLHQLPPLMYRWVTRHDFNELNWLVWGTDLYNIPGSDREFYEPMTWGKFVRRDFSKDNVLYKFKVWLTNARYKARACKKVDHVLTWMNTEYGYAEKNMPGLSATQKYFFYENDVPYAKLDEIIQRGKPEMRDTPALIVGNSGTPTNNHLDAVHYLHENGIRADLFLPVSYGDKNYIAFLKKNLGFYKGGKIHFMDAYMPFDEYVNFLRSTDGLIMNTIRPQGYGNIFMMMYLGKTVYINDRNISLPDIKQLPWKKLSELQKDFHGKPAPAFTQNVEGVFSSEKLKQVYTGLFA